MQVRLEYGRDGLMVDIPDANLVKTFGYRDVSPLADPELAVRESLVQPIGSAPLSELARGRTDACILICDITRPVPNELMLLPVLECLEAAGIARERILILIATGLHRPNEGPELVEMLGSRIVERYRIENHVGQDEAAHVYLGESPRGVPIWIDRRYVEADLKITTGLIEPHFMAGYSGGRKLICPGIASLETIREWHSPRFLESPNATSGVLKDNPVHEENTWIAQQVGCDWIFNVVIDAQRRPLAFFAGDMVQAFEAGVDFVQGIVRDSIEKEVDIVVTSGAGYPLDATFYQSVKGMVGAMHVVREGGTIIIAAGMAEGVGSDEFQQIFEDHAELEGFMAAIIENRYWQMDQWQLEELAKVVRKARVVVVTDGLPPAKLERLFVESAESVEQAIQAGLGDYGADASIAVIPKGPYVMAGVA